MPEKALVVQTKKYQNIPPTVEALKYDGTEGCAAAICSKWPKDFLIGVDKDDKFSGLYLRMGEGAFGVQPGDMVYRNIEEDCLFAVPEETFFELFHEGEG